MRIDNCVRILDGILQNTPSIDSFERIVFESPRISRGDCFFDKDGSSEAIAQAIEKGAYAIITTHDFMGDDNEIAWIKVPEIQQALIKLLRYIIAQKSLMCISATPLQASFLKMVQKDNAIKILKGSLYDYAIEIFKAKEEEIFCFYDATIISLIAPDAKKIEPLASKPRVVAKGLFIASFSYQEYIWHEQKIPSLFVADFLGVLAFCDKHGITWEYENLFFSEHFYPQFITPSLRKKEFGSSEQVLIFETDESLLEKELIY